MFANPLHSIPAQDLRVNAAFEYFKEGGERKLFKARCKRCGLVAAMNPIQQRRHLTRCSDYLTTRAEEAEEAEEEEGKEREHHAGTSQTDHTLLEVKNNVEEAGTSDAAGFGPRRRGGPSKYEIVATYGCHSLDDFRSHLEQFLDGNAGFIPTLLEAKFILHPATRFRVSYSIRGNTSEQNTNGHAPCIDGETSRSRRLWMKDVDLNVTQVLDTPNDQGLFQLQRAIAKILVEGIELVDGFGYGAGNKWASVTGGYRFKYWCHDSLQNSSRTMAHRKSRDGTGKNGNEGSSGPQQAVQGLSLPIFDCRGAVCVKFCRDESRIEVLYSHARIHRTVESRKANQADVRRQASKLQKEIRRNIQQSPIDGPTNARMLPAGIARLEDPTQDSRTEPSGKDGPLNNGTGPNNEQKLPSAQVLSTADPGHSPEPVSVEERTQNSLITSNGTPIQPGVFEFRLHDPNIKKRGQPGKPVSERKGRRRQSGLKRTRTGCYTCRERKTKCDEAYPVCEMCQKGGRKCSYREPSIPTNSIQRVEPDKTSLPNTGHNIISTNQQQQQNLPSQPLPGSNGWQYMPTSVENQRTTVVQNVPHSDPSTDQQSEASIAERLLRLLTQSNAS